MSRAGAPTKEHSMAASTPICDFGAPAPAFRLRGTDGSMHALSDIAGPKGMLIAFICNHCPYVVAIADRLAEDARTLRAIGIGVAAICSNDAAAYPQDAFGRMGPFAQAHGFDFPYLHDETQAVARAYGAVCTPDFFGYGVGTGLQYRGRIDAAGMRPAGPETRRELVEAMTQIASTGRGPTDQTPSMGCSIKWKAA
jgi:peroxiredoxin